MSLSISQIVSVSYNAVLNDKRKPANQWDESAFMRLLEKMGMIDKRSLGAQIECTLDYRRNPGADFLATDLTPVSLAKTEVLTAAQFSIAELSIPVVWSKGDDAKNPSETQKVDFVDSLLSNAFATHDDMIEEALFTTTTDGFLGMATLVPDSGQGTVGVIDASTEVMWRNPADTYLADGSDLEAVMEEAFLNAAKGTGSGSQPKALVGGMEAVALYTSTQISNQRFVNTNKADGSFETIAFKGSPFVYSQYGDDHIYGLGRNFKLVVSKQYFRDKGETRETDDANGFVFKIYSALQTVTNNKSRNFVVSQA